MKRLQERFEYPMPEPQRKLGFSGCVEFHGEDLSWLIRLRIAFEIPAAIAARVAPAANSRKGKSQARRERGEEAIWPANCWAHSAARPSRIRFSHKKEEQRGITHVGEYEEDWRKKARGNAQRGRENQAGKGESWDDGAAGTETALQKYRVLTCPYLDPFGHKHS